MKKLLIAGLMTLMSASAFAQGVHVQGHYRSNGTYVQPYYRSAPDSSRNNNWSVSPNINPYTLQQGTRSPSAPNTFGLTGWGCGFNC
jgi:hypothetical protein